MQWTSVVLLLFFARGVTPKESGKDFSSVLRRFPRDLSSDDQLNEKLASEEEPARELKRFTREFWSPWQGNEYGEYGLEPQMRTTGSAAGLASLFTNPEIATHSTSSGLSGEGGGGLDHGHSLLGGSSSLLGASSLLGGSSSLLGGSSLSSSHHHDKGGAGEWSAQINEPAHAHTYFTKVPYISGYKLTPIYSEKKIIVKDVAIGGGGIFQHVPKTGDDVPATEFVRKEWGWGGGIPPVSQSLHPYQPMYFVPTALYPTQQINGPPTVGQQSGRFATSPNNAFYLSGPGFAEPINLNSFFVDAAQLKESEEKANNLVALENCEHSIEKLQRAMDHLQHI